MNKILAILNSKYFLLSVIVVSILVIIVGVLIVKYANEQAIIYENQKRQPMMQQEADIHTTVKQLELLAAQAEAELKASQSIELGPPKKLDFTTNTQREKVAKMKNKNPEQGTDDWCEIMMTKPDTEWTPEEQGVFAKNCL